MKRLNTPPSQGGIHGFESRKRHCNCIERYSFLLFIPQLLNRQAVSKCCISVLLAKRQRMAYMTKCVEIIYGDFSAGQKKKTGGFSGFSTYNWLIAISSRRRVSSLPRMEAISIAPPGVEGRPVMATLSGKRTWPFFFSSFFGSSRRTV